MFATNCRNTYKTICVSVTAKKPERICGKLRLSYPSQKDGCLNQTIARASREPNDEKLVITETQDTHRDANRKHFAGDIIKKTMSHA